MKVHKSSRLQAVEWPYWMPSSNDPVYKNYFKYFNLSLGIAYAGVFISSILVIAL